MKRNSIRTDEYRQRTQLLLNIIDSVKDLDFAELCFVFSINPIEREVHGEVLSWQKESDETHTHKVRNFSPQLKKFIEKLDDGNFFYDTDLDNFFDLFDGAAKSYKKNLVVPFLTQDEQKPSALLFIGYNHSPKDFEKEISRMVKSYEPLLENTWLLGRYKVIAEAGKKINENLESYEVMFNQLLKKVSSVLNTSYYFLLAVYIPQANEFDKYMFYKYSTSPDKKDYRREASIGASKMALEEKTVISTFNYKEDIKNRPELKAIVFREDDNPNPQSIIIVPLFLREELLGVLSVQHEEAYALNWEDVRIMELLGNQVSLALNSIRLYNYLEDIKSAGAQLISPLSKVRSSGQNKKGFLSKIVKTIKERTKADNVILFPYSASPIQSSLKDGFERVRVSGSLIKRKKENLIIKTSDDIACLILRKFLKNKDYVGEFAVESNNLYKSLNGPGERNGSFEKDEQIESTAALPLKIDDDFVGVLFVNFRQTQKFEGLQKLFITTLAQYAALSIRIQKDFLFSKQKHLQALQKIDELIGEDTNYDDVLQRILDIAVENSNAVDSAIYLYDSQDGKLHPKAVNGPNKKRYEHRPIGINEKGLVTKAFMTRRAILVDDVQNDPDYSEIIKGTKSELDVPLIDTQSKSKKAIGVINLESDDSPAFHEEDKEFLTSIASQATLAIKIAEARKYASDLSRQINNTKKIAFNIIKQKSTPGREIQKILDHARELTGSELAILQLYEDDKPTEVFKSLTKNRSELTEQLRKIEPHKDELGVIKYVAEKKKYYLTQNTEKSRVYRGSPIIKSELAVPLKLGNQLFAVLDVESPRYKAFDRRHVKLLEEFAVNAVLVAQTANRALKAQQETRRFTILDDAMLALSRIDYTNLPVEARAVHEEKLFKIVIEALRDFKDEGEMIIRKFDKRKNSFELVELRNKHQGDVPQSIPYYSENGEIASINAQAAEKRKTIYEPDLDNRSSETVKPFSEPNIKCIVVVPVISEPNNYGNLVWSHTKKHFFDESDILLLEGLAAQLGAALALLEGAGRSEELETMSRIAEFVAEISHTLGSTFIPIESNVERILEAVSEQTELSESLKECEADILDAVDELREMVEDLKEKLLTSNSEVAYYKVDDLVSSIGHLVSRESAIEILTDFSSCPGWVRVDINEIVEIVKHLLDNAISMMEKGSIILSVFKEFYELIIEVSDNGPGVREEIAPLIFEFKFSTEKSTGKSTGLGLWASRRKARRNAGELILVDKKEAGAKFQLRLPLYDKPNESDNGQENEK